MAPAGPLAPPARLFIGAELKFGLVHAPIPCEASV